MYKLTDDLSSARRKAVIGLICITISFVLFEYFRTPRWGQALRGEFNLWNIGEAMMDFFIALIAFTCAMLGRYAKRRRIADDGSWVAWLLASFAFTYFTFDETLMFHERMGRIIRHSTHSKLLWGMPPHNIIEAGYYLGALVLTVVIMRKLWSNRTMFGFYMGGVAFMAFQTALGLLPPEIGHNHLPYMFAETLEMGALTCFASSFILLLFEYLILICSKLTDIILQKERVSPSGAMGKREDESDERSYLLQH